MANEAAMHSVHGDAVLLAWLHALQHADGAVHGALIGRWEDDAEAPRCVIDYALPLFHGLPLAALAEVALALCREQAELTSAHVVGWYVAPSDATQSRTAPTSEPTLAAASRCAAAIAEVNGRRALLVVLDDRQLRSPQQQQAGAGAAGGAAAMAALEVDATGTVRSHPSVAVCSGGGGGDSGSFELRRELKALLESGVHQRVVDFEGYVDGAVGGVDGGAPLDRRNFVQSLSELRRAASA